jgi:16S rRNA C967 or C1407 C5-methylase (RsmB/RsmF family)
MPSVVVGFAEHEVARVRAIALSGFEEARARQWPFLSDVLERLLRGVAVDDGAVIAAVVHALVKYDRLLGFAIGSEDAAARLDALLAMARAAPDERSELDARIEAIDRPATRHGVAFSFPDWLVELVEQDVGQGALESALARMNEVAPRVARVNSLKSTREACIAALGAEGVTARPTAHAVRGMTLDGRSSAFRTQAFARGDLEVQDEASQMVSELVAPPPGSFVIDACAGAGGKTLGLAGLLGGRGRVVALDVAPSKLEELRRRARRAGASNIRAIDVDLLAPDEALKAFEGAAVRVLVDAPCTGLGAIRRNPEVRWRLVPAQVASLGEAQRRLLRAASSLVAPKGRLVYATCSFLRREGEEVFESFLAGDARFGLVTARDVLGRSRTEAIATADGRYLRTWRFGSAEPGGESAVHPDGGTTGMDGFFAGVARLVGSRPERASDLPDRASVLPGRGEPPERP